MEISHLSDAEFKTLVFGMLKELSDDLNSTKKIQLETKYTLIEIKNNLQENNSRVGEAENQNNYLEYKEARNNQSEKQEEKRIQKIKDSARSLRDNFKWSNISHHRGARKRREKMIKLP